MHAQDLQACSSAQHMGQHSMQGHALSCCSCDHVTPVLVDRCTPSLLAPIDQAPSGPMDHQAGVPAVAANQGANLLAAGCATGPRGAASALCTAGELSRAVPTAAAGCGVEMDCSGRPRPLPPPATHHSPANASRVPACVQAQPPSRAGGCRSGPAPGFSLPSAASCRWPTALSTAEALPQA